MSNYTSKDFVKTRPEIAVVIPEKLLHENVWGAEDPGFSGERKHAVAVVDLPSKTLSVTLGGLEPGQSTNRHRHTYETVLYILEGEGTTYVQDRPVKWKAGDAVYVPVWAWHRHENASATHSCRYLACENTPLLQNLGVAIREEGTE